MVKHKAGKTIDPEIAQHLVESMSAPQALKPASWGMVLEMPQGPKWPDGYGKHKHQRERGMSHGRMEHGAAVTAVHRTSRPQMPHSS